MLLQKVKFTSGQVNIKQVLILVHVQLLSCLFFRLLVSLQSKTMSSNIEQER